MIFNCPECNAGHSVPVSMIPNGGLDMDCRRCGEAFTIEPPGTGQKIENADDAPVPAALDIAEDADTGEIQGEKTSVGPPPTIEETRVGVANPLEPEEEQALIGPGGIVYSAPERSSNDDSDSEFDQTVRVTQAEDDEPAPVSITDPGLIEPVENSDVSEISGLEVHPLSSTSDSSPSVYERVAAGIPVPEERSERRFASDRSAELIAKPHSTFQPIVDLLNGAPLALKVGLIVFPVTLGVMLVINSLREPAVEPSPIEIPVAAEELRANNAVQRGLGTELAAKEIATKEIATKEIAARAPEPETEKPIENEEKALPPPPAEPVKAIDDAPAPAGFMYVQVDDAKLRVRPVEKSGIAGRMQMGGLVRVYDEIGEFSLVASLPDGPAGFLSKKLLGPRKPLALLARDQAFERCTVEEGYSVDDCLFAAKQQEQPCLDRCGAVNAGKEAERLRCAEVCSIAFDSCARSCRAQGPKVDRGRRRRR